MGLQQVGNQNLFGLADIEVNAEGDAIFTSNNGVFASVLLTALGSFTVTMAEDFRLEPDDVIDCTVAETAGASTAHVSTTTGDQTQFLVRVTNGSDVGINSPFSIAITRTFRG